MLQEFTTEKEVLIEQGPVGVRIVVGGDVIIPARFALVRPYTSKKVQVVYWGE